MTDSTFETKRLFWKFVGTLLARPNKSPNIVSKAVYFDTDLRSKITGERLELKALSLCWKIGTGCTTVFFDSLPILPYRTV